MKTRVFLLSILTLTLVALTYPASASDNGSLVRQGPRTGISSPSVISGREFPDTTRGVHVFSDQLSTVMSDAQFRFAADHYAGTQKMLRADADRLRALNPSFLILHYRLGLGLGYRAPESGCQPTGDWLSIIEGNDWVREYPETAQENWFYHYPEGGASRVYNCDWGWYLMNLDDDAWRNYWQSEVSRQAQANDGDGVFMDSLSVPNYMGYDRYRPNLPALDEQFENEWSDRITNWLSWLQTQEIGDYYLIPNVGSWINSRDGTDYSPAEGVMVEGFAMEADQSPYPYSDWQLQMNRVLGLVQDKVIITQSYVSGDQERMFVLGSYLLIKGSQSYLNIVSAGAPEWYPEYDVPIGAPIQGAGSDITNLYNPATKVYRRDFDNGFVLVNAQDRSGTKLTVNLGRTYYLAEARGGGPVPASGVPAGEVTYQAVTRVTLSSFSAAVLFNEIPTTTSATTAHTSSITSSTSTLPSVTTNTVTISSSVYSESASVAPLESIPGFPVEAILLGVIFGLFLVSFSRSRRKL